MSHYRRAFWAALAANLVLLVVIVGLWSHSRAGTSSAMPAAAPSPSGSSAGVVSQDSASVSGALADPAPAPLQISSQRLQSIGVRTGEVERRSVDDRILTTGNVTVDETKLAYVQTRFSGFIQKVFVNATYQYVRKGQPLFTIYSPELVSTERELLVAKQNQRELARSSDPEVARDAASLIDASAERLKQWDIPQREISRLGTDGRVQQDLEIDSPVSGYVTDREALPNKYVQPDTRLYTVTDLSTIWVLAQVFQNDLGRLKIGDLASLTVDAYPGRTFSGRVDFVYPDVDMTTRTARVRLKFPNPDLKLMPGMFVNVSLKVPMGEQLVIPATGVLQTGTRQIVFVDRGSGNLEPREVQLGAQVDDQFIVLHGLQAGERIVTSANFLIDSESQLQAAIGAFTPAPTGAAATPVASAAQAKAEFSTDPNPPQKGNNLVRVKLTDATGAPLEGAQVTVTFFMPAMPAMGMAAMRTAVDLSGQGKGVYEGQGKLQSGGTFQVTILAQKKGQIVATQQLAVSVTGGM
jgi:Cu(I)/Ag(I) efflux system membrane fusion protein/cobalt-zinc-cadmium efflux system membrane fusion protein